MSLGYSPQSYLRSSPAALFGLLKRRKGNEKLERRSKGGGMNERIKALALQTGGDQEKFAALVIEDCLACCAIVAQAAIDARDGASDAYSHGREDAATLCKTAIKKHFEVEK